MRATDPFMGLCLGPIWGGPKMFLKQGSLSEVSLARTMIINRDICRAKACLQIPTGFKV